MLAISTDVATMVAEREHFSRHPTVLIACLLQKEPVQAALREDEERERKIREVVAQEYRHELEASLGQRADAIATLVDDQLRSLQERLDRVLSLEIQWAHDVISSGLTEQRLADGRKRSTGVMQLLMALEKELLAVRDELNAMLMHSTLPQFQQ
jgi:hypothetical protein